MQQNINIDSHRFLVAFTFPGSKRRLVRNVYHKIRKALNREEIFFDEMFTEELAVTNLDNTLRNIYHNADLIVPFLCSGYEESRWCGVEWESILTSIKARSPNEIMIIRLDNAEIAGLSWKHGYINAVKARPLSKSKSNYLAEQILQRINAIQMKNPKVIRARKANPVQYRTIAPKLKKILLLDALGQWKAGLELLKNNSDHKDKSLIKILPWEKMRMDRISEIDYRKDGSTQLLPIKVDQQVYSEEEWLYVFIAPLPLAAKFCHLYDLVPLGPAFATKADITVYVRLATSLKRKRLKIGVIEDDITSTIMLKILLCLTDNLFHPTPRALNFKHLDRYDLITHGPAPRRLLYLNSSTIEEEKMLDACIFTNREYQEVAAKLNHQERRHRMILNVDPPVAHYLKLDYVPRAVYFLHKSQYKNDESIHNLLRWLKSVTDKVNGEWVAGGMQALSPWSNKDRDAQLRLIDAALELRTLQHVEKFQFEKLPINFRD